MSSVGRNSVIMASGTAASRITGQIRTILLAAAIGTTGIAADAYQTGAMIPQVMFTLISGGIFNAVLVPQIVRTLKEKDAADRLNKLITVSMVLLAGLTMILMLATPVLTSIYLNSKWNPAQRALANSFTLWCMPQVFFYGLYTVLGQILAAKGRFTAYAWSSVGANLISCLGFLAFILLFGNAQKQPVTFWDDGKVALTAGAWSLGVAFQALILFIPLVMSGFRYRPRWGLRGMGLRSMGSVAAWSLGVVIIDQLANVVNARITNGAPLEGNPFDIAGNGSYQNAYTLFILPYSLIAVSVSTAIFPRLSKSISDGRIDDAREELSQALRNVGLMMFFFSTVMLAIPVPITRALLPSVGIHEAVLISGPLLGLSLGLVAMSAFLLIQRTFYAFEDGRHPFIFAAVSNMIQVILVLVAIRFSPPRYWTALVGATLALSNILSFPVLARMLRRPFHGHLDGRRILTTYAKALLASLLALAAALLLKTPVTHLVGAWVQGRQGHMSWVQSVLICIIITLVVGLVYSCVLIALKTTEFTRLLTTLVARLGRSTAHPVQSLDDLAEQSSHRTGKSARLVRSSSPDSTEAGLEAAMENLEEEDALPSDGETATGDLEEPTHSREPVRIVPVDTPQKRVPELQTGNSGGAPPVDLGAAPRERRSTLHESSEAMKPHIGDTVLARYTLVTILRRASGLSAWRAHDKALDRDCQLFIVNDSSSTDLINTTASGLALRKDRRFTPVYQLHTRDGISLIVTAPDAGMALRDYMQGPAAETLSHKAMRTILGEATESMRALGKMGLTDYTVSTTTIRLSPSSVILADAPIGPMIADSPRSKSGQDLTREELTIRQLAAVLYAMLTGHPDHSGDDYNLDSLPKDTPEEFRIICERGLGISQAEGVHPIPLVTLAELSALLSPWAPPEELTDTDLIWPDLDGRASIETVPLRQADSAYVLPLPNELTGTDMPAARTMTQDEPHWEANQLLFPGRSEIEMINPEDTNTDLFSLFDERQRQNANRNRPQRTLPMDVSNLRTGASPRNLEESKAVTGRMPAVMPDQGHAGIRGTDTTSDDPVELGFSKWDFQKPEKDSADEDSPGADGTGGDSAAAGAEAAGDQALDGRTDPSSGEAEDEGPETTAMEPLPPSFTPEAHSIPAPITYVAADGDQSDDDLEDGDMADTRLFGRFTTRSVVITIAILVVVVALVWALVTAVGNRPRGSKQDDGWPVMSNVPFPGESADGEHQEADANPDKQGDEATDQNRKQADHPAKKSSHGTDKKVGTVPAPRAPKNTTPYPVDRQTFLNKPAGLPGFGWYVHLTEPREVSRLDIAIPQSGGHAQIFANATATQPTQGQALADFSFDPSGTTHVTLREPVTTQDLVIWVPMDGMPGNTLHFSSVTVY
ncbi:murein biosynthesis integral membrane protein MurJ [Bifidobacterium indicum]|uniref:murein biosynthesis integral membrane protein MurJ n=1 Tax=Bifidobacterium indicum TaxID=1691 RepID=UPI0030D7D5B2